MTLKVIGTYRGALPTKFGIPKQSGLVKDLFGRIVLEPEYNNTDYIRGIEGFDYIWLLWGFSANRAVELKPMVRPPRLGGNEKMGVFATRSPYRPNAIGLSSVRLLSKHLDEGNTIVLDVAGADLMDGTPIYDIKPYIAYTDCHVDARSGFADTCPLKPLAVVIADSVEEVMTSDDLSIVAELLSQDPRPHYHDDKKRVYGMMYKEWDVHFMVDDNKGIVTVVNVVKKN